MLPFGVSPGLALRMAVSVRGMASQRDFLCQPHVELTTNLRYATAIAWGVYAYHDAVLPDDANNLEALAVCWQKYFCQDATLNTRHFVATYQQLVKQEQAFAA